MASGLKLLADAHPGSLRSFGRVVCVFASPTFIGALLGVSKGLILG